MFMQTNDTPPLEIGGGAPFLFEFFSLTPDEGIDLGKRSLELMSFRNRKSLFLQVGSGPTTSSHECLQNCLGALVAGNVAEGTPLQIWAVWVVWREDMCPTEGEICWSSPSHIVKGCALAVAGDRVFLLGYDSGPAPLSYFHQLDCSQRFPRPLESAAACIVLHRKVLGLQKSSSSSRSSICKRCASHK